MKRSVSLVLSQQETPFLLHVDRFRTTRPEVRYTAFTIKARACCWVSLFLFVQPDRRKCGTEGDSVKYLRTAVDHKQLFITFIVACWLQNFYYEGTYRKSYLSDWVFNPSRAPRPAWHHSPAASTLSSLQNFPDFPGFPRTSRPSRLQNNQHVGHRGRRAAPPGEEPGHRHQQSGGEVPEPGLRGSATALLRVRPSVPGRVVPGAALLTGLQRTGPELLQGPGGVLAETDGQWD